MMSEKDLALNGGVKVIHTDGDGVIDAVHVPIVTLTRVVATVISAVTTYCVLAF